MSSDGLHGKGSDVAELTVPGCTLHSLTRRSQADFEIDFFERILSRDPDNVDVLRVLGDLFSEKGWARRSLQVDLRLVALRPRDPFTLYNLACSHALLGHVSDALLTLRKALAFGFRDFETLATDPDLNSLRKRPEFLQLLRSAVTSRGS